MTRQRADPAPTAAALARVYRWLLTEAADERGQAPVPAPDTPTAEAPDVDGDQARAPPAEPEHDQAAGV